MVEPAIFVAEPAIFIVILNWNGLEHTLACLQSLQCLQYRNFSVIVVDNHSQVSPRSAIAAQFPPDRGFPVQVIENEANLGFAGGCNRGIRAALGQGADWVLLLNNDTEVDSQLLRVLAGAIAAYPQAGAFGAKIYEARHPDRLEFCGGDYIAKSARFTNRGYHQPDRGQWEQPQQSDYITGCVFLVSRASLEAVGLLYEPYFLLWEDLDLGWRLRRSGRPLWVIPQAKVWHQGSASFEGGRWSAHYWYFDARNQLLWLERNVGYFAVLWHGLRRLVKHSLDYGRAWIGVGRSGAGRSGGGPSQAGRSGAGRSRPQDEGRSRQCRTQAAALLGIWHYVIRRFGNCPPHLLQR